MLKLNTAASLVLIAGAVGIFAEKALAVPGDYNGDGKADAAIIDADSPEDKTTVFVRMTGRGNQKPYIFFPYGNHVISGNFFGGTKTLPGIVNIPRRNRPLQWRIKRVNGRELVFNFGAKGDDVPNQGDLDCDGITDYVVVRDSAGATPVWIAKLSGSNATEATTEFGSATDVFYTADIDGNGCSEIVTLSSDFVWSWRPFSGGTASQLQWGNAGDIPLLPADLDADGAPDFVVVRIVGARQIAVIRYATGAEATVNLGPSDSIPMIGNFFGRNTFGWFVRRKGRLTLLNLLGRPVNYTFGNSRRGLLRPDGTAVHEGQTGRHGQAAKPVKPADSTDTELNCTQMLRQDGSGGFKNNPENSKGTMKVIFPGWMTGKIKTVTVYKGDDRIDTLRWAPGNEWGNRQRYYGTLPLRSYPDNVLVAATLRDGRNICVKIPDPQEVFD